MNSNYEEYIQLPPLPRDTEAVVVQMFWEFLKLSEEGRKVVHAELKTVVNKDNIEPYRKPEKYRAVCALWRSQMRFSTAAMRSRTAARI